MKRAVTVLAMIILVATASCASKTYGSAFPQEISVSDRSTSAFPEKGAVSIVFDDGYQSQYDYAWPLLKAKGMTATFYVITDDIGESGYLTIAELQSLQNSGNEIASHSKTHPDFTDISDTQIREECSVSKEVLQSYGFAVSNFAYPYGGWNDHTNSIVSQYYRSARSGYDYPYVMSLPISQFRLLATAGDKQDLFPDLRNRVDSAITSKGWVIIVFHHVVPQAQGWAVTTQIFSQFLDYLTANGVQVLTVNQALDMGLHDVAVVNVVPSTVRAVVGTIVNMNVTVKNEGAMTETFNVTSYYNNNTIGTQAVTGLAPSAISTLTFNWNTNAVPPGNYTIKAEASTVPEETDTADNVYVDGTVTIVKPPTASFTYYPSNPRINEPVLLNASSSAPNGGTITNYRWNFDDGNTTSTPNPTTTHVYAITRTYNVTLTITDSEGLNASVWNSITTSAPIQTEISIFTCSSSNLVGFKVEINGTLTDAGENGISGASIVVSYTLPTASEWIPFISAITDSQGNYYSQWIPPATGDFTLKAEWIGNQTYGATNRNTTLSIIPYEDKYIFSVASNSTISLLTFNSTSQELEFNATGPPSTTGSTRVTIAKTLVANATKLKVYLDGKPLAYSTFSTDDSWVVSFTYAHSTHHIMLTLNPSRLRGDVNNDGLVNMLDLSIVAAAFGSRPGDPKWNSAADLDNNGTVNIIDINIVAREYGKEV